MNILGSPACSITPLIFSLLHDGDYIRVNSVDFGATSARVFVAVLSSTAKANEATGAKIEIRLGKFDGQLIGTLAVLGTGGEWKPQFTRISGASGVHDVFFVFRGAADEELFKFDYWQFFQRDLPVTKRPSKTKSTRSRTVTPSEYPL